MKWVLLVGLGGLLLVAAALWVAPDAGHLDLTAAGAPAVGVAFLRRALLPD